MTIAAKETTKYLTAADLANYGLAPEDVRSCCPWATEYCGLDGAPCWQHADLVQMNLASEAEDAL